MLWVFINKQTLFFIDRGCAAAVLRIWMNLESEAPPTELCGEKGLLESWHYISQGQSVRISFTTTDKTIGSQVNTNNAIF